MLQPEELKINSVEKESDVGFIDLHEASFVTTDYYLKKSVRVQQIQNKSDYERVLKLRYETYRAAEKIPASVSNYEAMQAVTDKDSQIYGVYLNDLLLASFRILVPQKNSLIESVDMTLGHYPSSFPEKTKTIEVANLCVRLGCRRTDILKAVFDHVHRVLVIENRSHILISTDTRLLGKYRFIGFKKTGYTYNKPSSRYPVLHIMITNQKPFGVYGMHGDPVRWNFFLGDVTTQLLSEKKYVRPLAVTILYRFYILFKPLADFLEDRLIAKRIRRE